MTDYLSHKYDLNDPAFASAFDELSFWSSRFGALLIDNMEIGRGLTVLDLGCGSGFPSVELANRLGASCHVVAIDIWREGINRAMSKQRFHNLANLSITEADGASMPFPDSTFDMIVSNVGLNNFADPQSVLAECRRVLRGGGSLYMTTNIKGHFAQFYDVMRRVLMETGQTDQIDRLNDNEMHRGTKESIGDLLSGAGFDINRTIEKSFDMRFADGSAMLNHFLVKIGFLDGWRGVVGPDNERAVFERVEGLLNEVAAKSGELRMTVPMLLVEARKTNNT